MEPITLLAALAVVLDEAFGDADGWSIPKIQLELRVKFKITASQARIRRELCGHPQRFFELERGKWKYK